MKKKKAPNFTSPDLIPLKIGESYKIIIKTGNLKEGSIVKVINFTKLMAMVKTENNKKLNIRRSNLCNKE